MICLVVYFDVEGYQSLFLTLYTSPLLLEVETKILSGIVIFVLGRVSGSVLESEEFSV